MGNIALGDAESCSADVLGHVYEYFLGEFPPAEGVIEFIPEIRRLIASLPS